MDSKEIELKGRALLKSNAQGDPSSVILGILSELSTGVKATEDILRSTRIGVCVNKLRSHKDPAVGKEVALLISKWRLDVKRNATSGISAAKGQNGTASPKPTASPAPTKVKAKHNVAPEKRNTKADNVDVNQTGNPTRDNCLKLMYDGLAFMSEEMPADVLQRAKEVELAAFDKFQPETSSAYKDKIRSLYQNLKSKTNPDLRRRVQAGEISAADLVTMSPEDMMSAKRKAEDEKLMKINTDKAMVAQEEKSISASLTCGKCGQKKVSYNQAQTRSADEPMTTFCECMNCGKRWKFS